MVKQVHLNFLARLVTRVNRPNLASATLPVEPRCRHSPRTRAACLPFIPARDDHVETRRLSEEANTTLAKGRNKAWTARRRNIALRDAQKPTWTLGKGIENDGSPPPCQTSPIVPNATPAAVTAGLER
ncbi:hypothetical protein CKAH01_04888 [Colletotrichum kahawae]|uniref:Uncharacterized protein n=1 Tax=Colletotrichum kahawae TaxID=34407 RepID=A0AAE0D9V6_COLKA|nr:hypothetical protein CKAH01_04888 [Colletotrichum kahawae]